MFRPLYDWVLRMAHHRHAIWLLGAVSFAESSFFPIPPDAMLIPMVLARREQAFRIALVCTIASVLGGMLGYYIGYGLMQTVGQWIVHTYHLEAKLQEAIHAYQSEYGTWIILLKGLTPIPFKLVTIASGAASFNFPLFVILCTITRGARFFLVAALLRRFGAPVQEFIEKRLDLFAWGFLALVVLGFAAIALLWTGRFLFLSAPACTPARNSLDTAPNPTAWVGSAGSFEKDRAADPCPAAGELWSEGAQVAKTSPIEFVKQVQTEARKIVWPTRRETVMTGIMVMIMTTLLGVFFLGIDSIFDFIVNSLLRLAQ